jgi:hypothetical protein
MLGEHEEESSQKITKLKALCKRLREDAQKLEEEKYTLEGMVESHDELIMEIAMKIGLEHMGEDAKDEDVDEDCNDGGDAAAPPVVVVPPPVPAPPVAATPEEVIEEEDPTEMFPEHESPLAHEVIMADAEPELPQPRLYRTLMRNYEESPSRMMDDLNNLEEPIEASSDMDEWFLEDGSNDRD